MSRKFLIIYVSICILLVSIIILPSVIRYSSLFDEKENNTLNFFMHNWGNTSHEVTVEVFDSKNTSVFNETYILAPGERSKSPITWAVGPHMYEVTLDNNITKTEIVSDYFDIATLHIDIGMYPDDPLILGIAVP